MTDLKTTKALVKSILEHDTQCRNSDSLLYLKVLSIVAKRKGIDLEAVSVPFFLLNLQGTEFPPFESVRRSRQKIQEKCPDLAACETVKEYRAEQETMYLEFARSEA